MEIPQTFTIVLRMENRQKTLLDMAIGDTATVLAISAQKQTIQKLHQLGIRVGVDLQLIRSAPMKGPLLVKVFDREIAVGFGLCSKILVGVKN